MDFIKTHKKKAAAVAILLAAYAYAVIFGDVEIIDAVQGFINDLGGAEEEILTITE